MKNIPRGISYTRDTFTSAFIEDLDNAKGFVLICSPFLRERRILELSPALLRCVKRGVRVCVLAQELYRPTDADAQAFEEAIQMLRDMGIHVTLIARLHVKLAIIDEEIIWDGSLNILSVLNTMERMTRWVDREMVLDALVKHKLDACEPCKNKQKIPIEEQPKVIGSDLALIRKRAGLNQAELARISQQNQATISLVEAGANATLGTVLKICDPLDCELRVIPKFLSSAVDELLSRSIPRNRSQD